MGYDHHVYYLNPEHARQSGHEVSPLVESTYTHLRLGCY